MKSIGNSIFTLTISPSENKVWREMMQVCDHVWDNVGFQICQSIVESVRDIAYEIS